MEKEKTIIVINFIFSEIKYPQIKQSQNDQVTFCEL